MRALSNLMPLAGPPDSDPAAFARTLASLNFALPPELEASAPPEARGLARDGVRLLVSERHNDAIAHARFRDLPDWLRVGDVLVINTSGTLPAALEAIRADGSPLELHLSTHLPGDVWTVEPRLPVADGKGASLPLRAGAAELVGEVLRLPGGATATLEAPYFGGVRGDLARPDHAGGTVRLWRARLALPRPRPLLPYLARYGFPIRYSYVPRRWPVRYYQTVYATEPGSAEMPSAGRAFTAQLITRLVARGVQVAPLLLHTGVASLEEHEPPYAEEYRVPEPSARLVNAAHSQGRRVIAVGTTVVRALESVCDARGAVHAGAGWTDLVVTPGRGIRAVDGLLTGLHEPRASHLAMLEALASRAHLRAVYDAALAERYLWHEFGDLHLLLP
ncbi:MAG TPA: S-adenosylmethionine:tRNA ribosyltransferase-isomerase [Ktedonobacterales bacterium]